MKIIYSKFEQDNIKKEKSNVKSYVPGAFKIIPCKNSFYNCFSWICIDDNINFE